MPDSINQARERVSVYVTSRGCAGTQPDVITAFDGKQLLMSDLQTLLEIQPDFPESDGTDFAHAAWWRGNDQGCAVMCQLVNDILDGKTKPGGVSRQPWEATRQRLFAIVAQPAGQAEAVAYQCRQRSRSSRTWTEWEDCDKSAFDDIVAGNTVTWEARALYITPPATIPVAALRKVIDDERNAELFEDGVEADMPPGTTVAGAFMLGRLDALDMIDAEFAALIATAGAGAQVGGK